MKKYQLTSVKLLCVLAAAVLGFVLSLTVFGGDVEAFAADKTVYEQKLYDDASIDSPFDDSSVLVVMDKSVGGINKRHKESFFKNAKALKKLAKGKKSVLASQTISVEDLTRIEGVAAEKSYLNVDGFRQILKISLPKKSKLNVLETAEELMAIDGVLWAGPNYSFEPAWQPPNAGGTRYGSLWGLHGSKGINAEQAWDVTAGSSSVRVGVIDTGIANHPDLNANLESGWDFYNNNSTTNDDPTGHGTHVAGTIAATGNVTNGVVGVAPAVKLVPLQVAHWSDKHNQWMFDGSAMISAITWAINNDIDIINFSGGGYELFNSERNAINNYKGLFVCSAGNDSFNNDTVRHYPSDYSQGQTFSDRVISVGSIDSNENKAYNSNYGAATVSIFAPGVSILSTYLNNSYAYMSGTSMAAPHVTGTAALLFSVYADTPHGSDLADIAVQVKDAIMRGAVVDETEPLVGLCVTGGRLDANKAGSFCGTARGSRYSLSIRTSIRSTKLSPAST